MFYNLESPILEFRIDSLSGMTFLKFYSIKQGYNCYC